MKTTPFLLLVCVLLVISACAPQRVTPDIPASAVKIGLAPYSQPLGTSDLLAGYIQENIPRIDSHVLNLLDEAFENMLRTSTEREYISGAAVQAALLRKTKTATVSAFAYWMEIGQTINADILLVPQIMHWQERQGGELGIERPAAVTTDMFLLDIKNRRLIGRSLYEEQQRALTENLLDLGKFIERCGKWVTAGQLALEGMQKAIKEFGL